MLGYSESFSFIILEQFDPPEYPIQIEHAQKFENIDFHISIVPFIVLRVARYFLEGKLAKMLEARVILAKIVEGCLAEEVSDIVG